MRLAWTTDIHLNFLKSPQIDTWLDAIRTEDKPDALLITGDIGEAKTLSQYLIWMVERLAIPIYFVLGNHDYYHGSVAGVRSQMRKLCAEYPKLFWLPESSIIPLGADTALVGHGAWSDGGYGSFLSSTIVLNDYVIIQDLAACKMDFPCLLQKIQALGAEAGTYLRDILPQAAAKYQTVYVALHSPPFQNTAWYEGKTPPDNDPYLPHFTCKAAGDALLEVARSYPQTEFIVLCGHTHGDGERQIQPNLRVITGGAEYGKPQIKQVFTIS